MHYCYIIYSKVVDRYYIGETSNFVDRLGQHRSHFFKDSYTSIADDWCLFLLFELPDISCARILERFLKRMKSKKFLLRLKNEEDFRASVLKKILPDVGPVPILRDEPR